MPNASWPILTIHYAYNASSLKYCMPKMPSKKQCLMLNAYNDNSYNPSCHQLQLSSLEPSHVKGQVVQWLYCLHNKQPTYYKLCQKPWPRHCGEYLSSVTRLGAFLPGRPIAWMPSAQQHQGFSHGQYSIPAICGHSAISIVPWNTDRIEQDHNCT